MGIPTLDLLREPVRIVPDFRLTWCDQSCFWETTPKFTPPSYPRLMTIAQEGPVEIRFSAPAAALDRLAFRVGAHVAGQDMPLHVRLVDRAGAIFEAKPIFPKPGPDGMADVEINLAAHRFEIGATYTLLLSPASRGPRSPFAIFCAFAFEGRYEFEKRLMGFCTERLFVTARPAPTIGSLEAPICIVVPEHIAADPDRLNASVRRLQNLLPSGEICVVRLAELLGHWSTIASRKLVVFCGVYEPRVSDRVTFDDLCFALHRLGIVTVFYKAAGDGAASGSGSHTLGHLATLRRQQRQQRRRCHFILTDGDSPVLEANFQSSEAAQTGNTDGSGFDWTELVRQAERRRKPHIVIVSVLYKKADIIDQFLGRISAQSYDGPITTVLVDDASPQPDAVLARAYSTLLDGDRPCFAGPRDVRVVANHANLGNCASRLAGLDAVVGDIYIVIDCDCLLNRDFVAAHVFEHWDDAVDVVIGPLNIESQERDPLEVLFDLEREPAAVLKAMELQDSVQWDGFLNGITRNFSVKKRLVDAEDLFDLDFSYSSKPGSGFGWEDVEMSYRLYRKGGAFRFTDKAFSVHCSHTSSVPEAAKVRGSMRNFLRLFEKHEDLALVARRWAVDTYGRIMDWAAWEKVDLGEDGAALSRLFEAEAGRQKPLTLSYRRGQTRPLRILNYRWHCPHQYELYKLPHEFTLATDLGIGMVDSWGYNQRPFRPNVRMVPSAQIDTRDFDVAILHFDENVFAAELTNGIIPAVWGDPFRRFLAIDDLPKIAICHGTPAFEGQYGLDPSRKHRFNQVEAKRLDLVERLRAAGVRVVCNSHQALDEWQFHDARVIWHGFDPQEFPAGTYRRDILALEADKHRPHYRGAWEHELVLKALDESIRVETAEHPGAALEIRDGNAFASKNFRSYIDRIRQFTVYLNTTLKSPMPRSRGEAMMTGVIPVCLNNHDVSLFIENRVNGFFADTPEELADYINHLFRNRAEAVRIGAAARRTALDVFNHDRYLTNWTQLLADTVGARLDLDRSIG